MTRELFCVLSPTTPWGTQFAPFVVTDTLSVYEAAMIYRDRHPAGIRGGFGNLNIYNPKGILDIERWIGRPYPSESETKLLGELQTPRAESEYERNRRISWEVACELGSAIDDRTIIPAHVERDPQGRTIELACTIRLVDLLAIAHRREDAGEILSSLSTWYEVSPPAGIEREDAATMPTGMPGRPSKGKEMIENEFKRRCGAHQAIASLDAEAAALLAWYTKTYPQARRPTVKTIKNNIRSAHRQWVASQSQAT